MLKTNRCMNTDLFYLICCACAMDWRTRFAGSGGGGVGGGGEWGGSVCVCVGGGVGGGWTRQQGCWPNA